MFDITFSKYHEELRKDAEERLKKEKQWHEKEGYSYEIVLVPIGVIFDEEGSGSVIMNPNPHLIKKDIKKINKNINHTICQIHTNFDKS